MFVFASHERDVDFVRGPYLETMGSMIERLFGWNQARQEENFDGWFKLDEVSIITADGIDVGWIQPRPTAARYSSVRYVVPSMQRLGIGTRRSVGQSRPTPGWSGTYFHYFSSAPRPHAKPEM
jgi:hypothetical protein